MATCKQLKCPYMEFVASERLCLQTVQTLICCLWNAGGGGRNTLIKVGMDVRRVQNLGRAKFPPKNLMPGQKNAQKPNDRASFYDFKSAKIENFQQVSRFFHSFIKYCTFFLPKIAKNLMPGQNLLLKT